MCEKALLPSVGPNFPHARPGLSPSLAIGAEGGDGRENPIGEPRNQETEPIACGRGGQSDKAGLRTFRVSTCVSADQGSGLPTLLRVVIFREASVAKKSPLVPRSPRLTREQGGAGCCECTFFLTVCPATSLGCRSARPPARFSSHD